MTRKPATPDKIAEAAALREAGFTVLAISQRTGIPLRTLERHLAEQGVKKGALKQEALDAARAQLLAHVTSDDAVRLEAAKLIADDLATSRHLRDIMLKAAEQLEAPGSLKEAALVMRALAAASVVTKNTSDMIRHSLGLDKRTSDNDEELPELVISELTPEQVAELRDAQKADALH